jgi:diketogulonate reductase-like aldo/keto reductase
LRWVLRNDLMIALPKASTPGDVKQLRGALQIPLSLRDRAALIAPSRPPKRKVPLEVI